MFLGAVPAALFHPVKWRSSVYSGWPVKTCSSQTIDTLYSNAQVWHQEHHSQYGLVGSAAKKPGRFVLSPCNRLLTSIVEL